MAVMMILVSGCSSNNYSDSNKYSFTDPDVAAYINGKPVYGSKKEQYIFMAKQFSQAVVDAGKELDNPPDSTDVFYQRMLKQASYNIADWDNEYNKTFLDDIMINEFIKDEDTFLEYIDATVLQETQTVIDNRNDLTLYNGSVINKSSIIKKVADHFDLSYEECVENIYKPFIAYFSLNESLYNYFVEYKYEGQNVKWDGTNKNQYTAFLSDAYAKYDKYIEKLLNESEIVLRPE